MTDALKLTNIRWIDDDIAVALEEHGFTVEIIAGMTAESLLEACPFVGTINSWLLVSEANYLMQQVAGGLWDDGAADDLQATILQLHILEEQERLTRIRPLMVWPPPQGVEPPPPQKSARVLRIERQQAIEDEAQKMREWLIEARRQDELAEQQQLAWQDVQEDAE